jgi:hypothetical protein
MPRPAPPILDYAPPAPQPSKLGRATRFVLTQLAPRVLRVVLLLMLIVLVTLHLVLTALATFTGRWARWLNAAPRFSLTARGGNVSDSYA